MILNRCRKTHRRRGGLLIESMIALAVAALLFMGAFAAVGISRVQAAKVRVLDMMLDFGHHYLEVIRSLPYDRIVPGYALNTLYDGSRSVKMPDGTTQKINVAIPASGTTWYSLSAANMLVFHPDLVFLSGRNPEYKLNIETQVNMSGNRARRISLSTRWDPPLGRGAKQTMDMAIIVYPEFR